MPPDASRTREQLLDAAAQAFAAHGVAGASLLDITRRAGQRNRGALHYHFGSRSGVVCAVLDRHVPFLAHREGELLAVARETPDDDVAAVVEAIVRPAAELADSGWRGRCALVILSELVEEDPGALDADVRSVLERTGGPEVYALLAERMAPVSAAVEVERFALITAFILRAVADRARLLERGRPGRPQLDHDAFVANLVAMVAAAVSAPDVTAGVGGADVDVKTPLHYGPGRWGRRSGGGAVRAVRVVRNGPPAEVVEVLDVEPPDLEPGMARVAVSAASINFGDIARCKGGVAAVMNTPPFTLGMDVCGVVEAEGEGVSGWLGKRVVATAKMSFGGMAELALVPATGLFEAPPELDDVEAAAFLLPFHTAWLSLHERGRLEAGETLLVIGAATSVGTAVIQLGVAAGARVIAVAGGPEKGALCRELGAEVAIDRTTEDLFDRVMEHTDGRGVDVVADMIGGEGTEAVWTTIVNGGRYVAVGFNDDPQSGLTGRPLRKVATGNFSVVGVMMGYNEASLPMRRFGVNPFPPGTGQRVHAALLELVASGAIRPTIGRRITMDQVAATLADHEARRTAGRSVVDVAGSVA